MKSLSGHRLREANSLGRDRPATQSISHLRTIIRERRRSVNKTSFTSSPYFLGLGQNQLVKGGGKELGELKLAPTSRLLRLLT